MTEGFGGNALTPPAGERDHARGPAEAPLTLVEYGDFECPYTRKARPVVERLGRDFGDRLRFVYRHFPLTQIHPHAQHAAEAAEAAASQGRFWEMHDKLFENQRALEDEDLSRYATQMSLDTAIPFGIHHRPHLPPSPETKRGGGSFQTTRCRGDSSTDSTYAEA